MPVANRIGVGRRPGDPRDGRRVALRLRPAPPIDARSLTLRLDNDQHERAAAVRPGGRLGNRRRAAWLAGTSLGILAALLGSPQRARAACLGENTASVTCDATNQATAGTLTTTFTGSTTVNVNDKGKIDSGGASATVTAAGDLVFNNNDKTFGITNTVGIAVNLSNDFGAITYTGSGAISSTAGGPGTGSAIGIQAISNAAVGGITLTVGGPVVMTAPGGIVYGNAGGIVAEVQNAANASALVIHANGDIQTDFDSIEAFHTGTGSILIDGSGNISTGILATGNGDITISGSGGTDSIDVSSGGNGNILIDRSASAVNATTTGGGNVTVTASGGTATGAVNAEIQSAVSTGKLTVNVVNGSFSRTGGKERDESALLAGNQGLGSSTAMLAAGATVSGNNGILASITNSASSADIIVAVDGSATGSTDTCGFKGGKGCNGVYSDAFLNAGLAVGGLGVAVSHPGSGNITITTGTASTVTGENAGIQVLAGGGKGSTGTGNINVTIGGSVTGTGGGGGGGGGTGLLLFGGTTNTLTNLATGSISGVVGVQTIGGSTTIDNAGAIAATSAGGSAVQFGGSNNTFIMDGPSATLSAIANGSGNDTFRFAGAGANSFDVGQIGTGFASLEKTGSSVWTLTGTASYAGPVSINGGALAVNGDLTSTSGVTVNSGGALTGTGALPNTLVNAGALLVPGNGVPGTSMTITGSLAFQSGAQYVVTLNPATASLAIVSGTATLGGATVNAVYTNGSYVAKRYTILSAGSVSGTFNPAVVNSNLPANFAPSLGYDASHAYLDLTLHFAAPPSPPNFGGGLTGNQNAVANALINIFNTSGGIPIVFGTLTPAGLTQAAGESATGTQQSTFNAMAQFLNLLTDLLGGGRGEPAATGSTATPFADDGGAASAYSSPPRKRSAAERAAYAAMTRKASLAQSYDPRWSVWSAGFGGSQTTDGNLAQGTSTTSSRVFGGAVGADYLLSPHTTAGVALAGGETSFGVANSGGGRSDLFQAGAFVRHSAGPAYVTGALAYGRQDVTTNRTVTIAGVDQLRAQFNADTLSGRLEAGYRTIAPWIGGIGLTPYAAGQFTTIWLPSYAEGAVSGANTFALAYGSRDVTDSRSELGVRTDKSFVLQSALLILRGRAAWAHDFNPDRALAATFQTLPGASFVVNGARQASDAALTSASAELQWRNGFALAGTFEGEFSAVTRSYAGKAIARYTW